MWWRVPEVSHDKRRQSVTHSNQHLELQRERGEGRERGRKRKRERERDGAHIKLLALQHTMINVLK